MLIAYINPKSKQKYNVIHSGPEQLVNVSSTWEVENGDEKLGPWGNKKNHIGIATRKSIEILNH